MLDQFLNQLDKVRKSGKDYYAVCPVSNHSGKRRTLSIREENGIIMAHCFSCGAKTKELASTLGIKFENRSNTPSDRSNTPRYTKERRKLDYNLIDIVENQTQEQKAAMLLSDKRAYRQAKERLHNFNEYMRKDMGISEQEWRNYYGHMVK